MYILTVHQVPELERGHSEYYRILACLFSCHGFTRRILYHQKKINTQFIPLPMVAYNIPVEENDAASIRGISDSDLYLGSRIKLAAGKHITSDSEREAMVNAEFAKQNNLKAGDRLFITVPGAASSIEVFLCGIFENTDETDETELSCTELSANFIYIDYGTAAALDAGKQGTISAEFFVDRPEQLSAIYTQVQKLDIDWNKLRLQKPSRKCILILAVIFIVSATIAVLYSKHIAKLIVEISNIARRMETLDMTWK